jgi:hypothetical protein
MAKATNSATTTKVAEVAKQKNSGKKVPHPLRGSFKKDGKKVVAIATASWPFESVPTDYDFKKHSPLTKKDFKSEAGFFDYLAASNELRAKELRDKADVSRTMGTGEDRKAAKSLEAKAKAIEDLVAKLTPKLGKDKVEAIIARAKAQLAAAGTATA